MGKDRPKTFAYIKFAMMKKFGLDAEPEPSFFFLDVSGAHGCETSIQNFINRGMIPVETGNFEKLAKKDPEAHARLTMLVNSYTGKGMDPALKKFIDPTQAKLEAKRNESRSQG